MNQPEVYNQTIKARMAPCRERTPAQNPDARPSMRRGSSASEPYPVIAYLFGPIIIALILLWDIFAQDDVHDGMRETNQRLRIE